MSFVVSSEKLAGSPHSGTLYNASMSEGPRRSLRSQFDELVASDIDYQMQVFLKSFIFALGDEWKKVGELCTRFKQYLLDTANRTDLNVVEAADFLQKQGRTRTAIERRRELEDVDIDNNDRICFIEYLLLHYKAMILGEWYIRKGETPDVSLENDCIGVVGVGDQLLEELFKVVPGMDAQLSRAIEEFVAKKKVRDQTIRELTLKSRAGGVKGLTAKTELMAIENQDLTEMNRVEITLEAAKRRHAKSGGVDEQKRVRQEQERLEALKKQEEEEENSRKDALKQSRAKLMAKAAFFNN